MDNINIFREIDKRDLTKETFFNYLQEQFNDIRCNTYKLKDDERCIALRDFFNSQNVLNVYGKQFESQIADMVKNPEKPEEPKKQETVETKTLESEEKQKIVAKVVAPAQGTLPKEIKVYKEKLVFLIQGNIETLRSFKKKNESVCSDTTSTEITGDSDDLNKITIDFLNKIGESYFNVHEKIETEKNIVE